MEVRKCPEHSAGFVSSALRWIAESISLLGKTPVSKLALSVAYSDMKFK
jgi:hypothetical protein